jgi:hypothetical protein
MAWLMQSEKFHTPRGRNRQGFVRLRVRNVLRLPNMPNQRHTLKPNPKFSSEILMSGMFFRHQDRHNEARIAAFALGTAFTASGASLPTPLVVVLKQVIFLFGQAPSGWV